MHGNQSACEARLLGTFHFPYQVAEAKRQQEAANEEAAAQEAAVSKHGSALAAVEGKLRTAKQVWGHGHVMQQYGTGL